MTPEELRSSTIQVLAVRMTLAALRDDRDAFNAAFTDFNAIRDADFTANGQSDIPWRLVWVLANNAAGATLDVEKDDRARAERFLEGWIQQLLGEPRRAKTGADTPRPAGWTAETPARCRTRRTPPTRAIRRRNGCGAAAYPVTPAHTPRTGSRSTHRTPGDQCADRGRAVDRRVGRWLATDEAAAMTDRYPHIPDQGREKHGNPEAP